MKKRILSLVLCAAMLLSMCLFLGAGVMDDTTADGSAESTESYIPAVNFTNVAPFGPAANGPARAPLRASANDGSTTPPDPAKDKDNEGLVTSKTATANDDGTYTITLEAFATGEVKVSSESKPCDIVLVLDRSTSMENPFSYELVYESELDKRETYYVKNSIGNYVEVEWCSTCVAWTNNCSNNWWSHNPGTAYTPKASANDKNTKNTQFYVRMSRMQALHSAANNFITSVNSQSPDSRIAVVSFGQYGYIHTGNSNTALLDVSDNTQTIRDAINDVSADESATEHGKGLVEVNNIFSSYDSTGRNRVVVMITDGEPAPSGTDNWSSRTVKQAIENAYTLKNTYAASVYCISVMPGTDASNPTTDMDKYMSYVSSNYPNARYLGNSIDNKNNNGNTYYSGKTSNIIKQITPGNKVDTSKGSYYLTAGDIGALNSIFDKISTQTGGSSVTLGSETVVRDVITPYFTVPDKAAVSVKSYECLSYDTATKTATWAAQGTDISGAVNITGSTIDVSNFDFSHNFVAETGRLEGDTTQSGNFHGRRLVISFTVTPKAGFLGGNNVPTNDATSGVYDEKGTLVENFDYPRVNVPITTPELTPKDANVYYGGAVPTAGELCTTGAIGEKMADYVDITYSVDGSTVSNTQDGNYKVTMTVSPKYSGANANGDVQKAQTKNVTSTVNVYKPEVTFKDSIIDYNATPNYEDNLGGVVWKHKDTVANTANMTGTEPTLAYTYDPAESALTQDTGVKVTVKIGNQDITGAVVFEHEKCSFSNCKYTDDCGYQFYVHINVFDLTIKKTAADGSTKIDENQTFVFHVKGNNNGVDMQVVITGPNKQVIKNLPVGNYTITEDTSWSWKYKPVDSDTRQLKSDSIQDGAATVTFENENKGTNWLTSLAKAINTWAGGEAHEKTN